VKKMAVYTTNWNLYRTHFKTTTNNRSHNNCKRYRLNKKEENDLLKSLLKKSMTFEDLLLEAIDEGLSFLGKQTKQSIYLHLKNKYALRKKDIPYRIQDFTEALEDTFQAGAKLLEIKIMKILFVKMGHGYFPIDRPECLEFTSYIYALRNNALCSVLSPAFC
jgi:hypothetical protein